MRIAQTIATTVLALASALGVYAEEPAAETDKEIDRMLQIGVPKDDPSSGHLKEAATKLPRVLLVGDSISGGYVGPVASLLKGKAKVERGNNGGTTIKGLETLDNALGDQPWDIIHFNWGLHDMTWQFRMKPEERGIAQYEARLEKLVLRLKQTHASLIWATTTPWPPKNYAYFEKRFKRKLVYSSEQQKEWREAALRVMKKHNIPVNDLHSLLAPHLDKYQKPDDVHFNREGSQVMGARIAEVVEDALKVKLKE